MEMAESNGIVKIFLLAPRFINRFLIFAREPPPSKVTKYVINEKRDHLVSRASFSLIFTPPPSQFLNRRGLHFQNRTS